MDPAIAGIIDDALDAVEEEFGRVEAVYSRGVQSCTLDLLLTDQSAMLASPDEAINVRVQETVFLASPADLDFGSGPVQPAHSDTIEIAMTVGGVEQTWTFTVQQSDGGPCWSPLDPYQRRIQIYAKLTGRE